MSGPVDHDAIDAIVDSIRPLLAGRHPQQQGAALAILTAMWIGGHKPDQREQLLQLQTNGTRALVPLYDRWGKQQ